MTTLAFGPLRYTLTGVRVVPAPLAPFVVDVGAGGGARGVTVRAATELPPAALRGLGFALDDATDGAGAAVTVDAADAARGLLGALAALVVRDAPGVGCVVLHAAAVRVRGGVALLVAPPGTGKSTAARGAGPRRFADNAVLVRAAPDVAAWALPFAGDPDAGVVPAGPARVMLVAEVARAARAGFEWIPMGLATIRTTRACLHPAGHDPHAATRAMITLNIAVAVPAGRLDISPTADYLQHLDRVCETLEPRGMNPRTRLRRAPDAAWRNIEGQVAIISVEANRVRLLNGVGSFVWERCDGQTLEAMVDAVCGQYSVDRESATGDVLRFVDDLVARGLLRLEEP